MCECKLFCSKCGATSDDAELETDAQGQVSCVRLADCERRQSRVFTMLWSWLVKPVTEQWETRESNEA